MNTDATHLTLTTTLGEQLITELSRRGQRGMYFDYNCYQSLRLIDDVNKMQAFLDSHGCQSVLATNDPIWLADGLAEAAADKSPPWWTQLDLLSVVTYPVWLLTRIRRKKRVFPQHRIPRAVS